MHPLTSGRFRSLAVGTSTEASKPQAVPRGLGQFPASSARSAPLLPSRAAQGIQCIHGHALPTDQRILAAAWKLFAAGGIDAVSLRQVAAKVRVTPMAIYRHFADKDALIDALVVDALDRWSDRLAAIDDEDPLSWLTDGGRRVPRIRARRAATVRGGIPRSRPRMHAASPTTSPRDARPPDDSSSRASRNCSDSDVSRPTRSHSRW